MPTTGSIDASVRLQAGEVVLKNKRGEDGSLIVTPLDPRSRPIRILAGAIEQGSSTSPDLREAIQELVAAVAREDRRKRD